jgi:hypothetical protein
MITLRTYRQHVETASTYFFPYINEAKRTRLNNLQNQHITSEEYFSAVVINTLLDDVEFIFDKKLITTKSQKLKFELSDAEGIVLYKTLLNLPLPREQIYFNQVRMEWLASLDQELIRLGIYQNNQIHKLKFGANEDHTTF